MATNDYNKIWQEEFSKMHKESLTSSTSVACGDANTYSSITTADGYYLTFDSAPLMFNSNVTSNATYYPNYQNYQSDYYIYDSTLRCESPLPKGRGFLSITT